MQNENRLIATREYKSFLERYIKELHEVDAPMIAGAVERCLYKLEEQPTVDAVPVVRCRDCRFCKKHPTSDKVKLCTNEQWNTEHHPIVHDNNFCSDGERRCNNG